MLTYAANVQTMLNFDKNKDVIIILGISVQMYNGGKRS